jgi:hypothetical protein
MHNFTTGPNSGVHLTPAFSGFYSQHELAPKPEAVDLVVARPNDALTSTSGVKYEKFGVLVWAFTFRLTGRPPAVRIPAALTVFVDALTGKLVGGHG